MKRDSIMRTMKRILYITSMFSILVSACTSGPAPAPATETLSPQTSVSTRSEPEATALSSPTAGATETPTLEPTATPVTLDQWAQSNPPDPGRLQEIETTYAQSMGVSVESIQTEVQMRTGVDGLFAVVVDTATGVPFFVTETGAGGQYSWQAATLKNVAAKRGMEFGALLNLNRDFHSITIENFGTGNAYIDWNLVQAQKCVWDFSDPGYNIDTAYANGLSIHANLIWGKNIADWAKQDPDLHSVMKDYITKVMTHYKGKVTKWSVYNEATLHGTDDIFWNKLGGMEAVRDAFRIARATDPSAELLYNDYVDLDGVDNVSEQNRFPTFEAVVSQIQADGNLDGIGLQVIAIAERFDADKLRSVLDALRKYNLPIHITEFSILINGDNTPANMAGQAEVAAEVIGILKEYENVVEVIAFPLEDRIANMIYLPNSNSGLWLKTDSGYIPKPIVFEMMAVLASDK